MGDLYLLVSLAFLELATLTGLEFRPNLTAWPVK